MTADRQTPTTVTDPGGKSGADYAAAVAEEMLDAANRGRNLFTASGTNTIALTGTPPVLAAMSEGMGFWFVPANANTDAVTVNPDGQGAVDLLDANGDALTSGMLSTSRAVEGYVDSNGDFRITIGIDGVGVDSKYAILTNTRVGAGGAIASASTWTDLAINTEDADTIGLTGTLPVFNVPETRTYKIDVQAGFEDTDGILMRLWNDTDSVAVTGLFSPAGRFDTAGHTHLARLIGRATLTVGKDYKFQCFAGDANGTDGQGGANSSTGFSAISLVHAVALIEVPIAGTQGGTGDAGADGVHSGVDLVWSTGTSGDPGAGKVGGDDATLADVAALRIDDLDANGASIAALTTSWGAGSSTVKGRLRLVKKSAPANWVEFDITAVADSTGYRTATVTYIDGSGSFSADDALSAQFTPKGDASGAVASGVSAKSASFSVSADDDGMLFPIDTSGGDVTASLPAAATAGAGFGVRFKKIEGSSNTVIIDGDGSEEVDGVTTFVLEDEDEAATVVCDGSAWQVASYYRPNSKNAREILTGNRTYYVDGGSGSDSNDGLSSGAGAFATIQKAVDVAQSIDPGVYAITISVADGTYAENITLTGPLIGGGRLTITGNTGTPANVLIQPASGNVVIVKDGAVLDLRGAKIVASSGQAMYITNYSKVYFRSLDFGAASNHLQALTSVVVCEGNYDITGNANHHIDLDALAYFQCNGKTVTLTGTPAFTRFIRVTASRAVATGNTYSGSATGSRYLVQHNGTANTGGGGATYFPGSTSGSTPTGGQYI